MQHTDTAAIIFVFTRIECSPVPAEHSILVKKTLGHVISHLSQMYGYYLYMTAYDANHSLSLEREELNLKMLN